ncbi:MAG: AbrB/MazE/SpoVT family DNA-binding domain-containing protein, partial [Candidatus Sulfotelmatobacter sp.]
GLEPGDRVEFVVDEGRTVIRPVRSEANPFVKYIGIADPFPGGEEGIKAWIDDMRSDKDYE